MLEEYRISYIFGCAFWTHKHVVNQFSRPPNGGFAYMIEFSTILIGYVIIFCTFPLYFFRKIYSSVCNSKISSKFVLKFCRICM